MEVEANKTEVELKTADCSVARIITCRKNDNNPRCSNIRYYIKVPEAKPLLTNR